MLRFGPSSSQSFLSLMRRQGNMLRRARWAQTPPRRHYSYYPPPELFRTPTANAPIPTNEASSALSSGKKMPEKFSPSPVSSISTFGASPDLLASYLRLPQTQLTLSSLLNLGGSPGVPPRKEQLLHSARFTANELPIRLARRVDQYRSLPFIVGSNPYITKIAKLYASSFDSLASLGEMKSLEDNANFAQKLDEMVTLHSENIPTLSRGFLECKRYMSSNAISAFLDGAIHARIGIRLIAEQHLALSHAYQVGKTANPNSVGIIDTKVNAYNLIRNCGEFVGELCEATLGAKPELRIEGDRDSTFVGVASHMSYCITELLKNSFRATVERHAQKDDSVSSSGSGATSSRIPAIFITIARSEKHLSIRIRDQGGGISPRNLPKVFQYTFTTVGNAGEEDAKREQDSSPQSMQMMSGGGANGDLGLLTGSGGEIGLSSSMGTLAGLGYGTSMSRIYAEHGRGELSLVSLWGHGTDCYLTILANPLAE